MAAVFRIAGATKSLQPGWRISETINGRNTMTGSVLSLDGTYRPAARAVTDLTIDSDLYYAGNIHSLDEAGLGGYGVTAIETAFGATDFNALPDRRQVSLTIPAGDTLKDGLTTITTYLAGYGVTLKAAQVDGPTFTEALVFEFGPLAEVLNKLSVITGYLWDISYTGELSMFAPGTTSAPFDIEAGDGYAIGDITVSPSLSTYANSVIVWYSESATAAYAFLSASGNFSNTETVTVGGKVYTFQSTLTNTDGNVKIGASAEASLTNLAAAITLTGTAGTDYAAAMSVNGSVTAYMQSPSLMKAVALTSGATGNTIGCTETAADAEWVTEGGGGTATLLFGADESLSSYVTATDSPAPDPADLVEVSYRHPEVHDPATAQALADGYLVRSLVTPRTIKYRTLTAGLHPGMKQHIEESRRNVDADCLITAVDITATGNVIWFEVTAVEGLVVTRTERDALRALFGGGSATGSISASISGGGGGTVLSAPVFLGGTDTAAIPMAASPVYTDVWNSVPFFCSADFVGTVRVWLWARDSGVTVTARLRNVTDGATVGISLGVTATARPSSPQTFSVALVAGKEYRLQVIAGTASKSVYGIGSLEAA